MPGRAGGFFKRLKAKQKRDAKKARRGTTGMKKSDRIAKHNALVDIYAAQRRLRDLDQVSDSTEAPDSDDVASDAASDDSMPPAQKKLMALREMLGVAAGAADDSDDSESVRSASDLGADSDDDAGAEGGSDEEDDAEGDGPSEQVCAMCSCDLEEADGVACPECRKCFCAACHDSTHAALGHDVVPLADLDGDEEDEEGDEEDGDDDFDDDYDFGAGGNGRLDADADDEEDEEDDEEDDGEAVGEGEATAMAFDPEANDVTAEEQDERRKAFLPAFSYRSALDNAAAREAVAKTVSEGDPWLATYFAEAPIAAGIDSEDDRRFVSGTDLPVVKPLLAEAAAEHNAGGRADAPDRLDVRVSPTLRAWAQGLPRAPATSTQETRPPFMTEFVWKRWCAYQTKRGAAEMLAPATYAKLCMLASYGDAISGSRSWTNEPSWIEAVVLHLLNHWAKSVAAMAANDAVLDARRKARKAKLAGTAAADADVEGAGDAKSSRKGKAGKKGAAAKSQEAAAAASPKQPRTLADPDDDDDDIAELQLRDRGFAKTRLLLVLPMRNLALQYITLMHEILGTRDAVGRARFETFTRDFSEVEEVRSKKFEKRAQEDFKKQFAGNIDDSFCVGASLRTTGMSIYAHPLNSDILVCSPLGLRKRLSKDADVLLSLSSIEVAIADQAHVLLMQNWEHFTELMKLVNRMPSDTTEGLMDLRRVFPWVLSGDAAAHRQTVLISAIENATFNGFLRTGCTRGVRAALQIGPANDPGVLPLVTNNIRQNFVRFNCPSVPQLDAARFEFFKERVFPAQVRPLVDRNVHTILYVPSTLDFYRLRPFLDDQLRGSYCELHEHSSLKAQRKALGQFSSLERPLLVMTERFYFFRRYFVKHAEALVCYSPPLFPAFYEAFVNRLSVESPNATIACAFCKYDVLELRRILGDARGKAVVTRPTDSFIFVSTNKSMV